MNSDTRFRVNTPDVTHEVIDGEAVIINLVSGNYYSLEKEGAEIWTLVHGGMPVGTIVEHLERCYDAPPEEIESAVGELITQLRREQLIVDCEHSTAQIPEPLQGRNGCDRPRFRVPVLHKFTDMQELLVLDPIHEVDTAGWPHKKTDAS